MKVECGMTCLQCQSLQCDTLNKKRKIKKKTNNLHVTQFVSYGEGGAEPIVLDDGTRVGAVAHGAQLG